MKTKPLTPQQAVNNFKLFLEVSPRNAYDEYRGAVRELAEICLKHGIEGDDQHKPKPARWRHDPERIVDEIARKHALDWDTDANINVLTGFIRTHTSPADFRRYVTETAKALGEPSSTATERS